MSTKRYVRHQVLPLPLSQTFEFFSDARNLERITPAFLRFEIVGAPPNPLVAGSIIDYTLRLHGIKVHWRTRITKMDPPHAFEDTQDRGPYRVWRHTHTFRALTPATTLVSDDVEYALPAGVLGSLVAGRKVLRDLDRIFAYRAKTIATLLAATN